MARARKAPEVEQTAEAVSDSEAVAPEVEQTAEAVSDSEAVAPEVEQTAEEEVNHRFETFEATRPDGSVVVVERNIDTGEQTVTEK